MLNSPTQKLYQTCLQFLQENSQQRLLTLKNLGLARYEFLTKMPLTEANVTCVMHFFQSPSRAKFPILRGAELSGLVLDGVNFIRGDLTGAKLQECSLLEADLIFANFTDANFTDADLRGATLNESVWFGALVEGCKFGAGIGLTDKQRRDLSLRGAIFD